MATKTPTHIRVPMGRMSYNSGVVYLITEAAYELKSRGGYEFLSRAAAAAEMARTICHGFSEVTLNEIMRIFHEIALKPLAWKTKVEKFAGMERVNVDKNARETIASLRKMFHRLSKTAATEDINSLKQMCSDLLTLYGCDGIEPFTMFLLHDYIKTTVEKLVPEEVDPRHMAIAMASGTLSDIVFECLRIADELKTTKDRGVLELVRTVEEYTSSMEENFAKTSFLLVEATLTGLLVLLKKHCAH